MKIEEKQFLGINFRFTYHDSGKISVSTPGLGFIHGAVHCKSTEKAAQVARETAYQFSK